MLGLKLIHIIERGPRWQATAWTNVDFLSIGPIETNHIEIWIKIQILSILKMIVLENFICKLSTILIWS